MRNCGNSLLPLMIPPEKPAHLKTGGLVLVWNKRLANDDIVRFQWKNYTTQQELCKSVRWILTLFPMNLPYLFSVGCCCGFLGPGRAAGGQTWRTRTWWWTSSQCRIDSQGIEREIPRHFKKVQICFGLASQHRHWRFQLNSTIISIILIDFTEF